MCELRINYLIFFCKKNKKQMAREKCVATVFCLYVVWFVVDIRSYERSESFDKIRADGCKFVSITANGEKLELDVGYDMDIDYNIFCQVIVCVCVQMTVTDWVTHVPNALSMYFSQHHIMPKPLYSQLILPKLTKTFYYKKITCK